MGSESRPAASPISPVSSSVRPQSWRGSSPSAMSVPSSRVRSTCSDKSALHTPMKATTTASTRSASVTANVRSKTRSASCRSARLSTTRSA